jgi:putative tricarboxylic transport membrane protein
MSLRDPLAAVVIFIFAAAFYFIGGTYSGGAEVFPRGVAMIMMICSVLLFFKGLRGSTGYEPLEPGSVLRVTGVVVLTFIYIVAVHLIGYVVSSLVFVPTAAYFLGVRNHVLIAVSTFLFVIVVAYLFRSVFHIPLPRDLLFTYF